MLMGTQSFHVTSARLTEATAMHRIQHAPRVIQNDKLLTVGSCPLQRPPDKSNLHEFNIVLTCCQTFSVFARISTYATMHASPVRQQTQKIRSKMQVQGHLQSFLQSMAPKSIIACEGPTYEYVILLFSPDACYSASQELSNL